MVAGSTQAIDSAYLKANASMGSLELKVPKEQLQQEIDKVRILSRADRIAKKNRASQKQRAVTARADELKEIESRNRKWKQEGNARPGASSKSSKYTSNKTHYSPVDPDARIAVKPVKPRQLYFLNQLSVDTTHHVITHVQADFADKKDSQCLPSILESMNKRLESLGLSPESIAADGGYCSGENYALLEKKKINAYIPIHGTYKGGPEGFVYHRAGDYWQCRNGKKATFRSVKLTANLIPQRRYFTRRSDCTGCPFKESCLGKKQKERKIDITYFMDEYERAIERLNSRTGRIMKKLRQSTVEPVFGTLINFMGLKKVNTRGIIQAEKSMLMAASAYNLKKWINFPQNRRKTAALALPKPTERLLFYQFLLLRLKENRKSKKAGKRAKF